MQPKNTPKQTNNPEYDPSVPLISVGDIYFMIKGAIALYAPTHNPCKNLKIRRV